MRFWIAGPRLGWFRPGVSFGRSDFRRAAYTAAASPSDPGYVYVITAAHGCRKIGSSGDPAQRLAKLQTGSPYRLWIEFQSPQTDRASAYRIELEAHAILDAKRGEGEWFAVTSDMAIATIFAAADRTGCSLVSRSANPPIEEGLDQRPAKIAAAAIIIAGIVIWAWPYF